MHPSRSSALLLPALLAGCGLLEDRDSFRIISPFDATAPRDVVDAARDARDAGDARDASDASDALDASDASDGGIDADVRDATNDLGDGAVDVEEPRDRTESGDAMDAGPAVCREGSDCPTGSVCCGLTGRCYEPSCDSCCVGDAGGDRVDASDAGDAGDATEPCPTTFPSLRAPWSNSVVTSETVTFRAEAAGATRGLRIRLCPLSGGCTFIALPDSAGGTITTQNRLSSGVFRWGIESRRSECVRPAGSVDWTFRVPPRTSDAARAGVSSGLMTDFNRDGRSELVAGAPYEGASGIEASPGAFYVISYDASDRGAIARASFLPLTDSPRLLGMTLSAAGDLNGDGFADLVVGGRIGATGPATGLVLMYFGNGAALDLSGSMVATRQPDYAITGLAGVGDVNLDGLADFVATAHNETTNNTNVMVLHGQVSRGSATAPMISFVDVPAPTPATFGRSISAAGDLDADAFADFAVGAPAPPSASVDAGMPHGRAFVYFGANGFTYNSPRELFVNGADATNNPPSFGAALANAGDFTGTGRSCVAVSSSAPPGGPEVIVHVFCLSSVAGPRVFLPPITLTRAPFPGSADLGSVLTGLGDVDGDGLGDIAVGSRVSGGVVVIYGRPLGATPRFDVLAPDAPGAGAGFAITGLGDVMGDSNDDMFAGHIAVITGFNPERIFVYPGGRGFPSSLTATSSPIVVMPPSRSDGFGRFLATGR